MSDNFTPYALIVDDDVIIRMDAVDILETAGFRVKSLFQKGLSDFSGL